MKNYVQMSKGATSSEKQRNIFESLLMFCIIVMNYCIIVMNYCIIVMNYCVIVMNFCVIVIQSKSGTEY